MLAPDASPTSAGARSPRAARPWTSAVDGDMLRRLRCQRGLPKIGLADKAGISVSTVAKLEGEPGARARIHTLGLLAGALGVPLATIAPDLGPQQSQHDSEAS
jgi:transcriptional regulator with XRE-family HTH domain